MNQRDRLVELLQNIPCDYIRVEGDDCGWLEMEYDEIADYLIAKGVIVPPCKVGDTVYRLACNEDGNEWTIADFWEVVKFEAYDDELWVVDDSDNYFKEEDIGKTVFLTREDAEKALEGKT